MKSEKEELRKATKDLEGCLVDIEGELLYDLARGCTREGVIVEIGSLYGKSTTWLGRGSKSGGKVRVYSIDPHLVSTFDEFKRNLVKMGVDDIVTPIVDTSEEAVKDFNEKVVLIFIDGDHRYESVKLDFMLWFPKVVYSGIMAFHDTNKISGPCRIVEEEVYRSKRFMRIHVVGSITYAEKVEENSVSDRLRNRYILALHHVCKFAGRLNLPVPIRICGKYIIKSIQ